jgi:flagellar motor switch protein FliN/FliY
MSSAANQATSNKDETIGDVFGADFSEIVNSHNPEEVDEKKNLNLLMDIRLGLIVELGRSEMHLKEILKLTKGSIIELDRLSGEPVDLFANNKLIARGEVVVIDDNFGLRITQLAGLTIQAELNILGGDAD